MTLVVTFPQKVRGTVCSGINRTAIAETFQIEVATPSPREDTAGIVAVISIPSVAAGVCAYRCSRQSSRSILKIRGHGVLAVLDVPCERVTVSGEGRPTDILELNGSGRVAGTRQTHLHIRPAGIAPLRQKVDDDCIGIALRRKGGRRADVLADITHCALAVGIEFPAFTAATDQQPLLAVKFLEIGVKVLSISGELRDGLGHRQSGDHR